MEKINIKILNENKEVILDDELAQLTKQAEEDYKISKTYIDSYERYIWRAWYKSYHLSTFDRKVVLWKNSSWKSNISMWLTRAFVDVLTAAVNEKPITFIGTWLNKQWIENKEKILNTLKYISDATWFHYQLKQMLRDWLITGQICARVWYKKTKKSEPIISIIWDKQVKETIETQEMNLPYASIVSIFNVFPDPYTWPLRYVTERWVVPYNDFIEAFWHLIRSKQNKSPFKDYVEYLTGNENWDVDKTDYGNVVNQIHQKRNQELREQDFYLRNSTNLNSTIPINTNFDEDTKLTQDLIEFKITTYKSRIVLIANGYPMYIWPNIYWFVNYIVTAANGETRFWEWIPYLTKPLEDAWNSFLNNYIDWARSIAQPTFVANKNLMVNDTQLQSWTPWGIVRTESTDWGNVIYRLDKWWLNDFNIIPLITQLAQQITGISEYNLWQSAWERTASWALAVTQSSQKRLSPYLSTFLNSVSQIAYMWLAMIKKFWVKEQFTYILWDDWSQVEQFISNQDLIWMVNLSLQAEWMFGSVNELELQKLISVYQTVAQWWIANATEITKEIFKKAWFDPARFIVEEKVKPDNADTLPTPTTPLENPNLDLWQVIQQTVNPQINLNNKWQWQ